jgi:hypothetical protein
VRPGPLIALLLVHAVVVLGGVALMLTYFGNQVDSTLNDQVTGVENRFDGDLKTFNRNIRSEVRKELDARLGPARSR